ncbi:uncharacterized protein LOC143201385 [Rhynchophorus ferrugineus]|uniref:uncharacterized protein LOC143201385 n=1 Tax=Rhynchophorus ferrugineus TaxID=354439 RepID=UPI003FCCCDF6
MATPAEIADEYINNLLKEGANIPCDDTASSFEEGNILPKYYNEELLKKAKKFYYYYSNSINTGNILGLLTVLTVPSILKILIHTDKSSSNYTAYRRYLQTTFHVYTWYESDFSPNSRVWRSIKSVKRMHNAASASSNKAKMPRISQKDMALTQFGFVGYVLLRSEKVGVHNTTKEDFEGFVHFWRIIGHILGIEDRFNLCSGSVEEATAKCAKMVEKVYLPNIRQNHLDILQMSRYVIDGLRPVSPMLNYNAVLYYLRCLLSNEQEEDEYKKLSIREKCIVMIAQALMQASKWSVVRWYLNLQNYMRIWIIKHIPILAMYHYGFQKAFVTILDNNEKKII